MNILAYFSTLFVLCFVSEALPFQKGRLEHALGDIQSLQNKFNAKVAEMREKISIICDDGAKEDKDDSAERKSLKKFGGLSIDKKKCNFVKHMLEEEHVEGEKI